MFIQSRNIIKVERFQICFENLWKYIIYGYGLFVLDSVLTIYDKVITRITKTYSIYRINATYDC